VAPIPVAFHRNSYRFEIAPPSLASQQQAVSFEIGGLTFEDRRVIFIDASPHIRKSELKRWLDAMYLTVGRAGAAQSLTRFR
jgi:hypothetical protein